MKRQSVESSKLASIGYDAENENLEFEFNHGGVFQYYDVPISVCEELMDSDSHGVSLLKKVTVALIC